MTFSKFHYLICRLAVLALAVVATSSRAATYYVATNGVNATTATAGSKTSPFLTINFAGTKAAPGDTVRVQPGLYEERVTLKKGGAEGAYLNYVADGNVICRGADVLGVSYLRFIGFEITHRDLSLKRGITFGGTCSHIEIIDNYIHDVYESGIVGQSQGTTPTYITIRGNRIDYTGHIAGVYTNVSAVGISSCYVTPNHWLIEYNHLTRCGDFINCFGTNNIIRNNYMHDYRDIYWNASSSWHSDMFQPGSDGTTVGTRHHVYERNFCGDSIELNSHFGIWQDTVNAGVGAGDTNIMIRGNVAFNFGSGGIGVIGTDKVDAYHNTFYKICQGGDGAIGVWYGKVSPPIGGLFANTIIQDIGLSRGALSVQNGTNVILKGNLGFAAGTAFSAGTAAAFVSGSDPLLIYAGNRKFRLLPGSPAIGGGSKIIWITSPSGSGTTFDINDGQLLIDGWGMVDGDTVTIGGISTVVTSITENTVTVADPVTWTNGDPVFWGNAPSADIGALPFGSAELTSAKLSQTDNTYTVRTKGDTRGVWFYVDGVPAVWVSKAPYTATIPAGIVTAKAYALYAQDRPVVPATRGVSPPGNLRAE